VIEFEKVIVRMMTLPTTLRLDFAILLSILRLERQNCAEISKIGLGTLSNWC
jgi:hypothetical protein